MARGREPKPVALGLPTLTETLDEDFAKAVGAEFLATLLFLFITISTAGAGSALQFAVLR